MAGAGFRVYDWEQPGVVPEVFDGYAGGRIRAAFDLTEIHGEREVLRQGALVDVDGDGLPELITRTGNANRARAVRLTDGSTVWLSPDIAPPPQQSSQVSQIDVGDLDGDGVPEVILCTYDGDVICLDARTGELEWHRRLDVYINNPRIMIRPVMPGAPGNLCFTVGTDVDFVKGPHGRPRINFVRKPSLRVLDHRGDDALRIPEYAVHNGDAHNTWLYDLDGDGCCEILACGDNRLVVFDHTGARRFELPCKPEGEDPHAHPDALVVIDAPGAGPATGRRIVYLNGTDGIVVADAAGCIVQDQTWPLDVASHLQEIVPAARDDGGTGLIAENIRATDSKLLMLDPALQIEWGARMEGDMIGSVLRDGDGGRQIACGSIGYNVYNPMAPERASLQIMDDDGTPVAWQRFPGASLCTILAAGDVDGDGHEELVVSVGTHGGPEGRWSLRDGAHQRILVVA